MHNGTRIFPSDFSQERKMLAKVGAAGSFLTANYVAPLLGPYKEITKNHHSVIRDVLLQ